MSISVENYLPKTINSMYFEHICKQLIKNIFSNANYEILIRKLFHPEKEIEFKDVIYEDDIYIQSISILIHSNLKYFMKSLEIIVNKTNYKVIDLKYDYYKNEDDVTNTNINISFN